MMNSPSGFGACRSRMLSEIRRDRASGRNEMDVENLVEGPLLWIVFLVLVLAILARLGFFSFKIIRDADTRQPGRLASC